MANWCNNRIEFKGSIAQLSELAELFSGMAEKEKSTGAGQLPGFVTAETGYLFDIRWEKDVLYYETRWVPNISVMKHIAIYTDTSFIMQYCEMGNLIYGEASFYDGKFSDIVLEIEDFDQYCYSFDTETYLFEGMEYEILDEILDILLERKTAVALLKVENNIN
jgi:hypothetical protein